MDIVKSGSTWILRTAPILDVTNARLTGLTDIKCSVSRYTSGAWQWLDFADMTFKASPGTLQATMTAVDATKAAGVYAYALDTSTITNATLGDQLFIDIQQTTLTNAINANQTGEGLYGYVVDKVEANLTVATSTLATSTNVSDAQTAILAKLPSALVGGRIDASVGAMAANTLTASALAADAVTEIQTGLATSALLSTPEVIEVGQSENAFLVFNYARNGVPVTGATLTFTTDRFNNSIHERYDWDTDTFMAPAAVTAPTVTMVELNATYAPGAYWWEWAWNNPSNNVFPTVLFITIKDGATVVGRYEVRSGTVNTINTIAAFGAPPSAATISAQVNADITTAHGAGSYQTASTAGLATGTNVSDAQAAILAKLPAALVGGRIDASVGAMAANTLTASALAADAVTEMQSGLATAAALATAQGNITTILGYGAPPTAAANAAAVWATTEGSGTMGASLALLRRRTTNKRHMNGTGVISFYADDGSTVEATATITDKDGVAISVASGDPARSSAEV